MKFLVLVLGSTTLVAGGTAITSQQDVRNNVIAQQRPYQEPRAASGGTDCPPAESPIFENVAHPLLLENPDCVYFWSKSSDADVDGDGILETSEASFRRDSFGGGCNFGDYSDPDVKLYYVPGTTPPMVSVKPFLDLDPNSMTYEGVDMLYHFNIYNCGYLDVTNDGKLDAILKAEIQVDADEECWGGEWVIQYFYVENISTPPAATCATDINNDGSTNVNDLLAVVGNWGPCK